MKIHKIYISALVACLLVACGGSSIKNTDGTINAILSNGITGTAATGAAIAGARVYIIDSTGKTPSGQDESADIALATTDANGKYSIGADKLKGLTGPFLIKVVGQTVTDSGQRAAAVFHAITNGEKSNTVNLTPLTEAQTALILGVAPGDAYGNVENAIKNYTPSNVDQAIKKLSSALAPVINFGSDVDFVTQPLDATPGSGIASVGKKYDTTLDMLAVTISDGKIIFSDRNQDESNYASGPRVEVAVGTRTVNLPAGPISEKVIPINSDRLEAFLTRFNNSLNLGCTLDVEPIAPAIGSCDQVTKQSSNIFHKNFSMSGRGAWPWMKITLADAFNQNNIKGTTVTLISSALGAFNSDDGTLVNRILIKFKLNEDEVINTLLVYDDGINIKAYGNQKKFVVFIAPKILHTPDNDNTYPDYPKYKSGLTFQVKSFYENRENVIFGAHLSGPGLPLARQAFGVSVNGLTGGIDVNKNRLSDGIETFISTDLGCYNASIESSVYVERNTTSTTNAAGNSIRFRPGSTSCDSVFDFIRYDSVRDQASTNFRLPKRGDQYTVTLYLKASKFLPAAGMPAKPFGVGGAIDRTNISGVTESVLPFIFTYTLNADAFEIPASAFDPVKFGFPNISDKTRVDLSKLNKGDDLDISWGQSTTRTPDGNYFSGYWAGSFVQSRDQIRSNDNHIKYINTNPLNGTVLHANNLTNCLAGTVSRFQGGDVITMASLNSDYSVITCAQAAPLDQSLVSYVNSRIRKKYTSDRGVTLASNAKSKKIIFSTMLARETEGDLNYCSAFEGFWRYREAYVLLADINGRMIQENRVIASDFPNATPYPFWSLDYRPNRATDNVYLAHTYGDGTTTYSGDKGFVVPAYTKTGAQCVRKIW